MKSINQNRFKVACSVLLLTYGVTYLVGCGGGGDPTPQISETEQAVKNLTGSSWKMKSVTIDGVDKSSLFTSFTMTFTKSGSTNGSYTTTGGGVVWPGNGNWALQSGVSSFTRAEDGLAVKIDELTETSFKMSLTWSKTTLGPGRIQSLKGQYVFAMGK